jgi:hypothetical protein
VASNHLQFDKKCTNEEKLHQLAVYALEGIKWFVPKHFPLVDGWVIMPEGVCPPGLTFRAPPHSAAIAADKERKAAALDRSVMLKRN